MTDKLTIEQLRERFEEIYKSIQRGVYDNGGFMSHYVFRRRLGLLVLGEYLPQYDSLSKEEKQNFGFDVDGLVRKVMDYVG